MTRVEFELHRVELVLVEQHVLALGDLEALDQVGPRDLLAGAGVDGLHLDAVVGLGIDQVEADGLRLAGRRPQGDRAGHQRQTKMPFPRWTRSHLRSPPIPRSQRVRRSIRCRRAGILRFSKMKGAFRLWSPTAKIAEAKNNPPPLSRRGRVGVWGSLWGRDPGRKGWECEKPSRLHNASAGEKCRSHVFLFHISRGGCSILNTNCDYRFASSVCGRSGPDR